MFLAIIIVPVSGMILLGGFNETVDQIQSIDPNLLNILVNADGQKVTFIGVISLLAWGLGYFGQPHILVRFMGIRDANQVKKSRIIAMTWVTLALAGSVLVGIIGKAYFTNNLGDPETVFMQMVSVTFHPLVAGILLAAISCSCYEYG